MIYEPINCCGLDQDTIDRMVDEACTIEKCNDIFPAQCVRDICCHVKALATEIERLKFIPGSPIPDELIESCSLAAAKGLSESLTMIEQIAGEAGQCEQSPKAEELVWLDGVTICISEAFAPVRQELDARLQIATDYQRSFLAKNKEAVAFECRLKLAKRLEAKWRSMSTKYMAGDIRGPLMGQMADELKEALGL